MYPCYIYKIYNTRYIPFNCYIRRQYIIIDILCWNLCVLKVCLYYKTNKMEWKFKMEIIISHFAIIASCIFMKIQLNVLQLHVHLRRDYY